MLPPSGGNFTAFCTRFVTIWIRSPDVSIYEHLLTFNGGSMPTQEAPVSKPRTEACSRTREMLDKRIKLLSTRFDMSRNTVTKMTIPEGQEWPFELENPGKGATFIWKVWKEYEAEYSHRG